MISFSVDVGAPKSFPSYLRQFSGRFLFYNYLLSGGGVVQPDQKKHTTMNSAACRDHRNFLIDLCMGLFRGAAFRHGRGAQKQPIDLKRPFSSPNGLFPRCLDGPLSLSNVFCVYLFFFAPLAEKNGAKNHSALLQGGCSDRFQGIKRKVQKWSRTVRKQSGCVLLLGHDGP